MNATIQRVWPTESTWYLASLLGIMEPVCDVTWHLQWVINRNTPVCHWININKDTSFAQSTCCWWVTSALWIRDQVIIKTSTEKLLWIFFFDSLLFLYRIFSWPIFESCFFFFFYFSILIVFILFRWGIPQLPPLISLWLCHQRVWLQVEPDHLLHWPHVLLGPGYGPQERVQGGDPGPGTAHRRREPPQWLSLHRRVWRRN